MVSSVLDRVAVMELADYHPGYVIQAVNSLQPQGKEMALGQIDSYLENRGKGKVAYGLFWVLRVLFEAPAERGFPPVRIGQPNIPPPVETWRLPRFPIVMIRDVPLLVVRGYLLGGLPEPVEEHVAYFRAYGTLREDLLAPPASTAGIEEEFLQLWDSAYGDAYVQEALKAVTAQIRRLVQ